MMEVEDIIQAVAAATFARESLRLVNVTREARRAIGEVVDGISDIEGSEPDGLWSRRVAASESGDERVSNRGSRHR